MSKICEFFSILLATAVGTFLGLMLFMMTMVAIEFFG
jgi:hypothetical protein